MKSPSILLSIVAAVTMTLGLSTSSVQAHDGSADLNHDGWVNSYDITILLAEWGHVADGVLHSDINGDFEVGAADFAILIGALGPVATTVSCNPIEPSLGKKLYTVISADTMLHVDAISDSSNWKGYLICHNGNGPQALISGTLTGPPSQFKPLALMSGEDDIVLSSDTYFTPANVGATENAQHDTDYFLTTGIPLNFTPSTPTGYVKLLANPPMIFSYAERTHPNLTNCTAINGSQCCLLTGCKLVGSDPSQSTEFPSQIFNNGTITIECTAPTKGSTVSNNNASIRVNPITTPFDLTVLSTAGFDPNGGNLSVKNFAQSLTCFISYASTDSITFKGCKVVADSSSPAGNGPNFTIKAGMLISMANLSKSYTINFSDLSGLSAAFTSTTSTPYGIYAMGAATGDSGPSWLDVDPAHSNSMKFVTPTCTASPTCFYPVHLINDSTTIILDSTVPLASGRIYFFVLPLSITNLDIVPFGSQPALPATVPFAFFEFTVPALAIINSGPPPESYSIPSNATFDVQQVDAFQFPMTMAWQASASDPLPTSNSENNGIFGQKICSNHGTPDDLSASRESILSAFDDFFVVGSPYLHLKIGSLPFHFPPAIRQAAGILAPSHYLETNVGSELNTVFDSDLKTLFSSLANGLQIWGNQSDPAGIAQSYYDVTFVNVAYPTDPNHQPNLPAPLIPALRLKTSTNPPNGTVVDQTNTFYIFSPTDTSIITTTTAGVTSLIKGTVSQTTHNSSTVTLTIPNPNPDLLTALGAGINAPGLGMFVFNGLFHDCSVLGDWIQSGKSLIQISDFSYNSTASTPHLTITLDSNNTGNIGLCDGQTTYFQFSRQPVAANLKTSGGMVFSNNGFFSDADDQFSQKTGNPLLAYRDVLASLENQIVTALNRGVLVTPANGKHAAKLTTIDSKDWSIQTDWYKPGTTYNEFSCFVHTAQIPNARGGHIPISYTPFNPGNSGAGFPMSGAYGFPFDENSQVGDYPQVPSKLDATVNPGSIITFTFGPWIDSICQ